MILLGNANFIKSKLVDFIIKTAKEPLIGSEVQFGINRSFADLVVLNKNYIKGYEIKAASDDFRNLKRQLVLYENVFDYVYIVVTSKHLEVAKGFVKGKTGLIFINSGGEIELIKEAELIKRNRKVDLLSSITKSFLKEYFHIRENLNSSQIRIVLREYTLTEIKIAYYNYLKQKLVPKNELFRSEVGNRTHFEDVKLLSFDESAIILNKF